MASNGKVKLSSGAQKLETARLVFIYVVCAILTILCLAPFWIMLVNSTRSSAAIQEHAISFIPSKYLMDNWSKVLKQSFNPFTGFKNSIIVSTCSTALAVYFSSLTAYAISVYEWKLKNAFFSFIVGVMMIPSQVTMIGFYQMAYKFGWNNQLFALFLPAIASPMMVFFMRQYLQGALSHEIIQSARIDGAGEFYTFNKIVLPIMKPAIATQAIFSFVSSWNRLFEPMVLISADEKKTLPMMVSLLKGDTYKQEFGCIYLGLFLTVLPLIIVYLLLSRYIVAGVALGSVKG